MSEFGKEIISALEDFAKAVKSGKPVKQTIMRRMTVKGKTVYTRETFTGPIKPIR